MKLQFVRKLLALALCLVSLLNLGLFPVASAAFDPLVLVSADEGQGTVTYRYNAKGQVIKKALDYLVTEYTYHKNGQKQKETIYQNGSLSEVREYDTHGNITGVASPDKSGKLVYEEKYANTYDSQGRLTRFLMTTDGCNTQEVIFTYMPDGSYWVDWSWYQLPNKKDKELFMHRTGYFTSEGRQLSQCIDCEYGEKIYASWSLTLDAHGQPLTRTYIEEPARQPIVTTTRFVNTYDASGLLLSVKAYSQGGDGSEPAFTDMALDTTTEYTYDDQGRQIRVTTAYEGIDGLEEYWWKYDKDGNLVACYDLADPLTELDYMILRNNGFWPPLVQCSYTYLPLSQALKLE